MISYYTTVFVVNSAGTPSDHTTSTNRHPLLLVRCVEGLFEYPSREPVLGNLQESVVSLSDPDPPSEGARTLNLISPSMNKTR